MIGFIGGGNMTRALVGAFSNEKIIVSNPGHEKLEQLKTDFGCEITNNNIDVLKADIIFLSVKPQIMQTVVDEINGKVKGKIIVSIAAGLRLDFFNELNTKVVRLMPNTPCLVNEMAAGYACNDKVTQDDKKIIHELFNKAGLALEFPENKIDLVASISGSGPAFIARFVEGFIEAGVDIGLNQEDSKKLVLKTFLGTSKLLETMETQDLIDMVSSPKGSTLAGREILDNSKIKQIISDTIKHTLKRNKELGK